MKLKGFQDSGKLVDSEHLCLYVHLLKKYDCLKWDLSKSQVILDLITFHLVNGCSSAFLSPRLLTKDFGGEAAF